MKSGCSAGFTEKEIDSMPCIARLNRSGTISLTGMPRCSCAATVAEASTARAPSSPNQTRRKAPMSDFRSMPRSCQMRKGSLSSASAKA